MKSKEILRFIDRLYRDLYLHEEVLHHSSGDKTDKFRNISEYLNMMGDMHERASLTENRREMLKRLYHQRYVIKAEDVPGSYYGMQERIALERGFGHVKMTDDEKAEVQREVIENQTKSLDAWLDYFLSEDSNAYPFWVKYWAFQGMLTLGSFDKKRGQFNKRTRQTVAPFVDLNREALSLSMDMVIKFLNKEEISDPELEKLVEGGSFARIYTYILNNVLKNNGNIEKRNEGIWVKYNQGNDYMPLVRSLAGYNTGWCTAGENTARQQLSMGDFYVYYTLDKNGEYKIPRIAIRMEDSRIGEIRGVAESQNLEPEMEQIVEAKIKDFPDRELYAKQVNDMRMLTEIYNKHKNGIELSLEELKFLYEIDSKIVGFGYGRDPRIDEIIRERNNQRNDLAKVFNCESSQVALSKKEITENTVYYCGNLYLFDLRSAEGLVLPQHIVGDLYLSSLKSAESLILPQSIRGSLYLGSIESAEGLVLPQSIGGNLYLSHLRSAEGLILPQSIGGSLSLSSLKSAKGLVLSQSIGGSLYLGSIESAEGLVLPQSIGGNLYLSHLRSAEGLILPQSIGGYLYLHSLESANGLILPDDFDLSKLMVPEKVMDELISMRSSGIHR